MKRAAIMAFIAVVAALLFIPLSGNCPLFDWDEVNFAECAREMLLSGDYSTVQLNFRPFWEKPPFFIWMQALSMRCFGVNEFAARFPNGVCGVITLLALFRAGCTFHSRRFGLLWAMLYAATLLPHLYFRTGVIDPWFNLFIFLAIYQCILLLNDPRGRGSTWRAIAVGVFTGLAVLTKGPVAILVIALTVIVAAIWSRSTLLRSRTARIAAGTAILASGAWFAAMAITGHGDVVSEFVNYQVRLLQTGDAGHSGPVLYHVVVLLIGCFPASIFFIAGYRAATDLTPFQRLYRKTMLALFWIVLVIFSVVKTKIIHYSSLCYFPLTFIAAAALSREGGGLKLGRTLNVVYWTIAGLFTAAFVALVNIESLKPLLIKSGLIGDTFAVMNLQATVHWPVTSWLIPVLFIAGCWLLIRGAAGNGKLLTAGLVTHILFLWTAIAIILPRAEMYTQHAAIAFYQQCAVHDCHVETHAFKSYAYLFYSRRKQEHFANPWQRMYVDKQLDEMEREGHSRLTGFAIANMLWMERGTIDKPAYIVSKTPRAEEVEKIPGMHRLYDMNGYSFFVRMPGAAN